MKLLLVVMILLVGCSETLKTSEVDKATFVCSYKGGIININPTVRFMEVQCMNGEKFLMARD